MKPHTDYAHYMFTDNIIDAKLFKTIRGANQTVTRMYNETVAMGWTLVENLMIVKVTKIETEMV